MDLLTIASIGMQSDLAKMESISHNTSNALTPGFKRQVPVTPSFAVEMSVQQNSRQLALRPQISAPTTVSIDPSSGPQRHTGKAQDAFIEGGGFFELATPAGPAYTKHGSFRADMQGRLVTSQHLPVMGIGGEIRVTNDPFTISPNGDVTQSGRVIGRLKVVSFTHPESLIPSGAGMYTAGNAQLKDSGTASLRIGFVEGSNVSTPQEMVRLTETMRHFESLQKLVQGYDESLEKTIRKLGEF